MSKMKTVFITGASGQMGGETLKAIASTEKFKCTILLRDKPRNRKLAEKLDKKYGSLVTTHFGDISNPDDAKKCISDADYVLHCAAIIPPAADQNPTQAEKTNFIGTKVLVDAVKASPRAKEIGFVSIGTVAEYGNRDYQHPWGRVGDPLVSSPYDFYAVTKIRGERYLLDANLPKWASLRQSGILYDDLIKNNSDDGLMFHTPWNVPIEWVTSRDSGIMLRNLVIRDSENALNDFWNKVYNIGGGEGQRVTGFETMDAGFKLMGGSAKSFFKPKWCAAKNFHCFWYYDSDVLNDYLEFQNETFESFWKGVAKKNWYFKLGCLAPKSLIRKLVIEKLFKNNNSTMYWYNHNITGRLNAFYGSKEEFEKITDNWDEYPLLCEGYLPNGKKIDYQAFKKKENADKYLLDHGYDETKKDSELTLEDMKQAAKFRGGECLSADMTQGDLYTKLTWKAHTGEVFEASPYTVIKAGHWAPKTVAAPPWNLDEHARNMPFYAQIWYDTHDKSENNFYPADCYKDILKDK